MGLRQSLLGACLRGGLGLALVAGMVVSTAPRVPLASAADEVLPDLKMKPLSDFQIGWVNGRRMLRFTAMMVNIGAGHFEVRGSRANTSSPMLVSQVIFKTTARDSDVSRVIPTGAEGKWSGDGHNHWHVQEMMRFDMWGDSGNLRGAKVGFCFLDSDPYNLSLPGASSSFYYRGSWCATTPSALSNRMGISVGWGDEYEWYLAWQWVDITGIGSGTFTVRSKVDPYGFFLEEDEDNQCTWTRVSFTTTSNAVSVLGSGNDCVTDWQDSPFSSDIAWMWSSGITSGCGLDLYCPNQRIPREQMAAFLVRALDLPPTSTDYFTDDGASAFEGDINAIAAAGITSGCTATSFCPKGTVTREQMASFLVRALDLPASATDHFTDDDDSVHEGDINALADAGITGGCTATRFCGTDLVTRGQMAAFLHRALED